MPSSSAKRPLNILVVDDVGTPSVTLRQSYTDFVTPQEAKLFIVSSKGGLSKQDKQRSAAYVELASPTADGTLELVALAWHAQHKMDVVYCKQEDLLLRVAHLRQLMGVKDGLQPQQCLAFRDKCIMKQNMTGGGSSNNNNNSSSVLTPQYKRLMTPSCLLAFIDQVGYPVIVKPTLGSASAGISIIRNHADLQVFLSGKMFTALDTQGLRMDLSGDMMAEKYLEDAPMFHVNGYMRDGKLVHVWPFQYLRTNLGFTQGTSYGNVSIPPTDPLYAPLVRSVSTMLQRMDKPRNLVFHAELFQVTADHAKHLVNGHTFSATNSFALCEVAARRPGGSIASLIQNLVGMPFHKLEFRLNCGLAQSDPALPPITRITGDVMIPHRPLSRLQYMPTPESFPFDKASTSPLVAQYVPLAKRGHTYIKFDINKLNTAARFVATGEAQDSSFESVVMRLLDCETWFMRNVRYTDLSTRLHGQQQRRTALVKQRVAPHVRAAMKQSTRAYNAQRQLVPLRHSRKISHLIVQKARERVAKDTSDRQLVHLRSHRRTRHVLVKRVVRLSHALSRQQRLLSLRAGTSSSALVPQTKRPAHVIVHKLLRKLRSPSVRTYTQRSAMQDHRHAPIPLQSAQSIAAASNKQQLVPLRTGRLQTGKVLLKRVEHRMGGGLDWMQGKRYVVASPVSSYKSQSSGYKAATPKTAGTATSSSSFSAVAARPKSAGTVRY
ncbi:hypothetical protein RI367_004127 [Sorochytrium milnesiophthora]